MILLAVLCLPLSNIKAENQAEMQIEHTENGNTKNENAAKRNTTEEETLGESMDTEIENRKAELYSEEDVQAVTQDLMDRLNLEEIDELVREMLDTQDLSFSEMLDQILSGELKLDGSVLLELLAEVFVGELLEQKEMLLQLLLLILVSALLMNLSHLFEDGQLTNVTYYIIYLMIFVLLMRSFSGLLGQVEGVLSGASSFMKVLTPAYFLAISAANGSLTAAGYYELVLVTISLVQWVLLNIGIPGVQMYVVLGLVNYISGEDSLSKMAELINTVVIWLTKTITAVVVGLQVVQKMISPALDMVKRGVIGKTAGAIPGIGNAIDSVTEMTVGCAILVRNCMGAVALIVLVLFGLGPVIQVGATTLLYRLLTAVAQPVSDKRLIKSLTVMAEACGLLLRILLTAEILFLLTIAIVAMGGGE